MWVELVSGNEVLMWQSVQPKAAGAGGQQCWVGRSGKGYTQSVRQTSSHNFQNSELDSSFQKTEEWEKTKTEADMEEYVWKDSSSEKNILETLLQTKAAEKNLELSKEELLGTEEVEEYRKSVVSLKNEGDNENTLSQYKESVKRLLNLTWII